jgi:hypothetical protein
MGETSAFGIDGDEPHGQSQHAPGQAPTSTHAESGAGRPRLIFKVEENWDGTPPREFELLLTATRIGSGPEMDLQLADLEPFQAEIVHTDEDEYVLTHITDADDQNGPVLEQAGAAGQGVLRTGSPVVVGAWAMSYYRDEYADHGRPGGGRAGGEGAHQPGQKPQNQ